VTDAYIGQSRKENRLRASLKKGETRSETTGEKRRMLESLGLFLHRRDGMRKRICAYAKKGGRVDA